MPDLDFLLDVEALAEFVRGLAIEPELRGRVERIRCDVHDALKPYRTEEKTAVRARRKAFRERVVREAV